MEDDFDKGLLPTILGSSTVRYYPALAKYVGGAKTALFLSQLLYWKFNPKMIQRIKNKEGWFYISVADMEEQTGLTRHEQDSAKKDLQSLGVLEITYKGISPKTTHFRVNIKILNELVSHSSEKRLNEQPDSGSLVDGKAVDFNTDTTHTTTETNPPAKAGKEIVFPASLNTDEFSTAWKEWKQYRSQIHKKLTDMTQAKQLKMLEKFGSTIAVAMIEQSISSGWQGLFELKKENEPLSLGIRN
ncbi:MAG: hypothetical protein M0Q91_12115 [Methanoregula sp.]|nr:hypothetical protein [Methanoregula sp.]